MLRASLRRCVLDLLDGIGRGGHVVLLGEHFDDTFGAVRRHGDHHDRHGQHDQAHEDVYAIHEQRRRIAHGELVLHDQMRADPADEHMYVQIVASITGATADRISSALMKML